MTSVPCWTKPLERRTFHGEHADSPEEMEIDSLRHQLREARAEVLSERKGCADLVRSYSIRFTINGVDTGFSSGGLGELADLILARGGE